jgi:MOSC domain-containing protein YiiM
VVGARLAALHKEPRLKQQFVAAARNRRGVVGLVLAAGLVRNGDELLLYPPV